MSSRNVASLPSDRVSFQTQQGIKHGDSNLGSDSSFLSQATGKSEKNHSHHQDKLRKRYKKVIDVNCRRMRIQLRRLLHSVIIPLSISIARGLEMTLYCIVIVGSRLLTAWSVFSTINSGLTVVFSSEHFVNDLLTYLFDGSEIIDQMLESKIDLIKSGLQNDSMLQKPYGQRLKLGASTLVLSRSNYICTNWDKVENTECHLTRNNFFYKISRVSEAWIGNDNGILDWRIKLTTIGFIIIYSVIVLTLAYSITYRQAFYARRWILRMGVVKSTIQEIWRSIDYPLV